MRQSAQLGALALASRLRHLSDLLMKDAATLYRDLGVNFQPRWFLVFYTLGQRSPQAITEIAEAIGLTHTAVNQVAGQLLRAGLVRERADRRDGRRRLLSLSPQGRRVHGRLLPIWHAIRDSTDELLADARTDLLRGLDRVEAGHARASVLDRVRTHLDLHPRRSLRLVDYRPAYKKHFRALNEAWLTRHFRIEPPDRRLLEDPNGRIVRQGGQILFALWGEEVVGTCALVRHRDGTLELTKLAVAAHASSQGVGRALAEAIIERARATDAEALYLLTSPKLEAAIKLYRQLGFRPVKQTPLPEIPYRRTTFAMHKQLRGSRPHDGRGPSGPRGRLLLGP